VLKVRFPDGAVETLPRANVEMIEADRARPGARRGRTGDPRST